ncbi:hypothetical protein MPWG_00191 [Micromonas pusilla virus PL1]|nr:hypothetical protein MPWG_00191 [Micromonas pusilla virus PL1]
MSVEGNEGFLEIPNASLRVSGNVHAEGIKLGVVELIPSYDLASVSNVGNTTSNTVQFTNPTTSLVASSNIVMLNTANTAQNIELSVGENTNVYTRKTVLYPDMLGYTDTDGDLFGQCVAISGDGKVIAAAAPHDDDAGSGDGAVYIFTQNSLGEWQSVQKFTDGDENFGGFNNQSTLPHPDSLSLSADGSILVVGNQFSNQSGVSDGGMAVIYTKVGATWSLTQKIFSSDIAASDYFGSGVCVSGDGSTIVVGAPGDDDGASAQGSAYIFEKVGGTWTQVQKIIQSDTLSNGFFGSRVRISDDGTTLVVGAYQHDGVGANVGAAYIFDKGGGGTWSQTLKLYPPNTTTQFYAQGLDISGDGNVIAVGAPTDDTTSSNMGQVFMYVKSGGAWSNTPTQTFQYNTAVTEEKYFGWSVGLSQNGNTLIVGAPYEDTEQTQSGAIHIYERTNGVWTPVKREYTGVNPSGEGLGTSVAISDDGKVYIAGNENDDPVITSGTVKVYDEKIYIERMTHLSLRCPVMFEASCQGLTFNAGTSGGSVIVKWNYVHLNVGGGYDNKTGLFTAPIRGYYMFNANLMKSYAAASWLMWGWFKNGIRYHNANQPSAYDTTSNNRLNIAGSIIVDLEVGDTFAVHTTFYYNNTDHGGNTISGFYLSA